MELGRETDDVELSVMLHIYTMCNGWHSRAMQHMDKVLLTGRRVVVIMEVGMGQPGSYRQVFRCAHLEKQSIQP